MLSVALAVVACVAGRRRPDLGRKKNKGNGDFGPQNPKFFLPAGAVSWGTARGRGRWGSRPRPLFGRTPPSAVTGRRLP